jgi:ABC-2 type transport system ATP-binding protein
MGQLSMIEVENLRFAYDSVEALRGISFQVRPGEICGYLGPNGAGKSTTVKSLVGILTPRAGSIRICGHDVHEAPLDAKRQVGYVPENAAAFGLLTASEYLELVGDLYEVPRDALTARIETLLANFGLGECAGRRIDTFSKGQRQRTALAAALVHDPPVLILDEPLTGLDANAARTFKEFLIGVAAQQRTVLFCSHVLEVVERICHRVVVLNKGEIVANALTHELIGTSRARNLEGVFRELTLADDDGARQLLTALGPGPRKAE